MHMGRALKQLRLLICVSVATEVHRISVVVLVGSLVSRPLPQLLLLAKLFSGNEAT